MDKIVDWFVFFEKNSMELYKEAAFFFKADPTLSHLLRRLSDDEAEHCRLMSKVSELLNDKSKASPSEITLDETEIERTQKLFERYRELIDSGELTEGQMAEGVFNLEFFEWNEIFLYIVNMFKDLGKDFERAAAAIEKHKATVIEFFRACSDGERYLAWIDKFPTVWRERMLVVEDYPPMCQLLKFLFEKEYDVETARDGAEGYDIACRKHFDLIISDVNMPRMDGIDFYRKIAVQDPRIANRFLFITANGSSEVMEFFSKHNLMFIKKPASIAQVKQAVKELTSQASKVPMT